MRKIGLVILLITILIAGCKTPSYWLKEAPIAEVNGDIITFEDMKRSFEKGHGGHGAFLEDLTMNKQYLQKVIDKQLLVQEGLRIGLDEDEDIQEIIKNSRDSKLVEEFYTNEIVKKVNVSEDEIKDAFEKSKNLYKVLYILVENEEEGRKALERVNEGEDFEKVASEVSIHESKARGGKLGFVMWGVMNEEIENALLGMKEGEIKGPFKTEDGWAIVKVTAVEPQDKVEYEKVRDELRNKVYKRKLEKLKKSYFEDLRNKYNVKIYDSMIEPIFLSDDNEIIEKKKDEVLVSADGFQFTVEDIRKLINFKKLNRYPKTHRADLIEDLINNKIDNKLLVLEAEKKGYDKKPEILKYEKRIRDSLVGQKLLATVIARDLEVSEEEMKDYYEKHKDKYILPEKVLLSAILVDDENKANEIKKKLEEGADFAEIAKKESKDASGVNGGQVGWFAKNELRPSVVGKIFDLKENEIMLAKEKEGYYILKVTKRQEERQLGFDEVKDRVRNDVYKKKYNDRVKEWTSKLRENAEIDIHNWNLRKATKVYIKENYERKERMNKKGGGH
ncbi:MAG: hypothetical protein D6734_09710 [Candidatus Schekmanbacteria bacterium]|nr:MAG: hypothetical protein D6734_09710 [Candidatus Schekmanbacteria bacterium]